MLGLVFAKPSVRDGLLIVMHDLRKGVETLAASHRAPPLTMALTAGHCVEVALKASLAHAGIPEKTLRIALGHNLIALWERAAAVGLAVGAKCPQWVEVLNEGHDGPNHFARYYQGIHGHTSDQSAALSAYLTGLVDAVVKFCAASPDLSVAAVAKPRKK